LLGSPRRISALSFNDAGGRISAIVRSQDAAPVIASATSWFNPALLSDMFSRPSQTPLFVLLTILAAFALGALHAVEPGHGKALLAFTLVGSRATSKQALVLAGSLTIAHTIGVFVLGAVLFFATGFVSESIYPWITLLSGAVIAIIGARTLARFVRGRAHASDGHYHDHSHDHHHGDASGHGHSHAIPGSEPLNFGSAVWAAMSGGIAPCPAAIVVLLAALRLHHLPYGMLLIVVFSMGLAGVLSGLGLGVVRGAAWLSKRSGYARVAAFGPLLTACVISVIGSVMLAQGMTQEGVSASVPLLVLIALAAIAGYALAQRGHHHHSHLQTEGGRA
jgi:ABC-type nickel/cobalt efflux system permease component RcnA